MSRINTMGAALIGLLVVIAFLNHGAFSVQGTPQGTSLGIGYGR